MKKFGVGSNVEELDLNEMSKELEKENKNIIDEKDNSSSRYARNIGVSQKEISKGNTILRLLKSQSIRFWIFTFLFSFCMFIYTNKRSLTPQDFMQTQNMLKFLLFPFAAIFIGDISLKYFSKFELLKLFLYPSFEFLGEIGFGTLLWYALKVLIYAQIWNYSIILGIIGLILRLRILSKIN